MKVSDFLTKLLKLNTTVQQWTESDSVNSLLNTRLIMGMSTAGGRIIEKQCGEIGQLRERVNHYQLEYINLNERRENILEQRRHVDEQQLHLAELEKVSRSEIQELLELLATTKDKTNASEKDVAVAVKYKKTSIKNYRIINNLLVATEKDRGLYSLWCDYHGIKIFLVEDDENDQTMSDVPRSTTTTMMELRNILVDNPEKSFFIEFRYITLEEGRFNVRALKPSFPKAYEIIKKVNESQNFIEFIIQCKKLWIESHSNPSRPSDSLSPPQKDVDRPMDESGVLFDSPPSQISPNIPNGNEEPVYVNIKAFK